MPGESKRKPSTGHSLAGRFGPHRRMWVKAYLNEFLLYIRPPSNGETGQDVELVITGPGNRKVSVPLCLMSEDELLASKHTIDVAFEAAREVVLQRDAEAEAALADGNTGYGRSFRDRPTIWRREGGTEFAKVQEFLPSGWDGDTEPARGMERSIAGKTEIDKEDRGGTYGEGGVTELD